MEEQQYKCGNRFQFRKGNCSQWRRSDHHIHKRCFYCRMLCKSSACKCRRVQHHIHHSESERDWMWRFWYTEDYGRRRRWNRSGRMDFFQSGSCGSQHRPVFGSSTVSREYDAGWKGSSGHSNRKGNSSDHSKIRTEERRYSGNRCSSRHERVQNPGRNQCRNFFCIRDHTGI